MTNYHDPYSELELYLQKAQEEIGIAVKELEEHEEAANSDESSELSASTEALLLPPHPFRSQYNGKISNIRKKDIPNGGTPSVNRVCFDGNVLNKESFRSKSLSSGYSRSSFFTGLNSRIHDKNESTPYSPNTRRKLWRMHPSISFPETSKDLLSIGREPSSTSSSLCNTSHMNGFSHLSKSNDVKSLTLPSNSNNLKRRQRSNSDTSPPRFTYDIPEEWCPYPRPPSGDVNLLSIWADNLVLELDKSLSGELNSPESYTPSSDYSLSPTKQEAPSEPVHFEVSPDDKNHYLESNCSSLAGSNHKAMSISPDSGIDQALCHTPEILDDCVDSAPISKIDAGISSSDSLIPQPEVEPIAPPQQFEDKAVVAIPCKDKEGQTNITIPNGVKSDRSQATQTHKFHCPRAILSLRKADVISEAQENCETLETTNKNVLPEARGLAAETVDLEDSPVVRTVCAVNDVHFVKNNYGKENDKSDVNDSDETESIIPSIRYRPFYSLPKFHKTIPNNIDKCNTLPKDSGKCPDSIVSQRSVSQSAVSTVSYVSIDELAEFMRHVKSNSYQLPSRADVSTDVKDDKVNKDAITQTSPAPLSRSSSFTWVTDCDCSDWEAQNANSASDDESLVLSSCSNCRKKNGPVKSSSSSLSASSGDEGGGLASPGSDDSSSLYLSACSGSSDSFEEATITADSQCAELPAVCENDQFVLVRKRPLRNSETTIRGSTLDDISEEHVTSESTSVKSTISNPSITDSNIVDPMDQSASFPSTLKLSRKNRFTGSPAQPIEPTILIINDLNSKSMSAPVLLRQKRHVGNTKMSESSSSDSSPTTEARKDMIIPQIPARAHSAKELNELQAIEACSWLRAAGFPQYAQMYEDSQFPIDVSVVQKDHTFLHDDSIQSLFRRLNTLNRCAKMKFKDHAHRSSLHVEESDDEEQYALSENWEFQRSSRRWSRIPSPSDGITEFVSSDASIPIKASDYTLVAPGRKYLSPEETYCSSHDSVFVEDQHSSPDSIRRSNVLKNEKLPITPSTYMGDYSPGSSSGSGGTLSLASEDMQQERRSLRRSGSDRVKEGAKALLKRMESLKGKRKKKVLDINKTENVNITHSGTDGSSSGSLTSSPQFRRTQKYAAIASEMTLKKSNATCHNIDDVKTHSDSECRLFLVSDRWKDANSNDTKHMKHYITNQTSVTVTSPSDDSNPNSVRESEKNNCDFKCSNKKNFLHPDAHNSLEWEDNDKRGSFYDNVCAPLVVFNDLYAERLGESGSNTPVKGKNNLLENSNQNQEDGDIIIMNNERRDSGVGSSLTRGITYQQAPWHCFPFTASSESRTLSLPVNITDLTAPQILLLQKFSLLKLTTIMEKFSPSSKTGWTWGVSKFLGRIRSQDYKSVLKFKDKAVFGVPLLLILQRTGQPLPVSIQAAIHHLRNTALDSNGLFRKSGVRSRIQKLRSLNETTPDLIDYDEQQAYDIADMLKQYFRELPEALLTSKLSETFIGIFQYVPEDLRLEAIHTTLMLMPDENREVLQSLLEFLYEVCKRSGVNQMTATNIAVCFAPSLFQMSSPRSASSSPRRRKTVGVPDLKELNENRAAYECLACMVSNYQTLFSVSEEIISQCRISSASFSTPTTLEELSSFTSANSQSGLRGYIESCIQMFLKETKEKYKGWKTVSQNDHVELSYKKVADGHPLKLWKVSTEVEAPPVELLNRILRERHVWDKSYTKGRVVCRLDKQTEVIQYQSSSLPPHPPCDFCILKSWRTDLPKGACILVETSVEHPNAEVLPGSVRGLILASRYLIEPCGSGKSRITHISRVDTKGRSPEWYNRAYGHICTLLLVKLRNSFSYTQADGGPETKV